MHANAHHSKIMICPCFTSRGLPAAALTALRALGQPRRPTTALTTLRELCHACPFPAWRQRHAEASKLHTPLEPPPEGGPFLELMHRKLK